MAVAGKSYLNDIAATTAELNTMDGILASTAELNILDGCTTTFTELNYLDLSTAPNADNTTFLRGDATWQAAGSTDAGALDTGTLLAARLPAGVVIKTYEEAEPEIVKGGLREKEIPVADDVRQQAHFAYHTDAGQAFYPRRHRPSVFMVGPVKETLEAGDIRAFYSDGSVGICFLAGVWHAVPIPLEREEMFKSIRGDQDFVAHTVTYHYDQESGLAFEPDLLPR